MDNSVGTARKITLQERDLAVLQGLLECRVMQRRHITAIHFDGRDPAAKKRLQALLAANMIREQNRDRHRTEKAVYCLTGAGFATLNSRGLVQPLSDRIGRQITWSGIADRHDVRPTTLAHELAVMDVKAAFHAAARARPDLRLAEFWTWPSLFEFRQDERPVRPDAFARLVRRSEEREFARGHYLEIDRHTESHRVLNGKIEAYGSYAGSAEFARFFTGSPDSGIEFRVLFIFAGDSPSQSARSRLLNCAHWFARSAPKVRRLAWLASHTDVMRDPLGAIWTRPDDYRQAVAGSQYDVDHGMWEPRSRETPRDVFVESRLTRRALFAPAPSQS